MILSENRFPLFGIMRVRRNRALIAVLIETRHQGARGRGVQHKVFRVERMFGGRVAARPTGPAAQDKAANAKAPQERAEPADTADATVQSLRRELALLHDAVARNKRELAVLIGDCLLYTSPSPRDRTRSRMPSSA